jgi:hypothetical protein
MCRSSHRLLPIIRRSLIIHPLLAGLRLRLYIILSGRAQGWNGSLGQNGWGAGYNGEYNVLSAFVFEVVATFLFSSASSE